MFSLERYEHPNILPVFHYLSLFSRAARFEKNPAHPPSSSDTFSCSLWIGTHTAHHHPQSFCPNTSYCSVSVDRHESLECILSRILQHLSSFSQQRQEFCLAIQYLPLLSLCSSTTSVLQYNTTPLFSPKWHELCLTIKLLPWSMCVCNK